MQAVVFSASNFLWLLPAVVVLLQWKYKEEASCVRCLDIIAIDTSSAIFIFSQPLTSDWHGCITSLSVLPAKVLGLDGGDNQMMGSDPFVAGADQITSLCLILLICKTL